MKILSVETSGLEASIALSEDGRLLDEQVLDTVGRRSARLLVPAVGKMLQTFLVHPTQVDVVAISAGPGSFTGLRVGIVFAKTFAWINGVKLVAMDTLQGLAQRAMPTSKEIVVISDAQRGDVFVNSYRSAKNIAEPVGTVRIQSMTAVLTELSEHHTHLLTGPGVKKHSDRIPDGIAQVAEDRHSPRASALVPAAEQMISAGRWADPQKLEPIYLRRSYAEEKKQPGPHGHHRDS